MIGHRILLALGLLLFVPAVLGAAGTVRLRIDASTQSSTPTPTIEGVATVPTGTEVSVTL